MVQNQPLKGKTIVVTRPIGQANEEADIIRRYGGIPYLFPTIEIKPRADLTPIQKFIDELGAGKFDFVAFMSVNGVRHLWDAAQTLKQAEKFLSALKKAEVVAIGPRTAQELVALGVQVKLVPAQYTSESIAADMAQLLNIANKQIAIPRTTAANQILKEKLEAKGALVSEIYVYESKLPDDPERSRKFLQDLSLGKLDAVVFGSGLCAKNLFLMLADIVMSQKLTKLLNGNTCVVAIGPVTAQALKELGVVVKVMPTKQTFEDTIAVLAQTWQ